MAFSVSRVSRPARWLPSPHSWWPVSSRRRCFEGSDNEQPPPPYPRVSGVRHRFRFRPRPFRHAEPGARAGVPRCLRRLGPQPCLRSRRRRPRRVYRRAHHEAHETPRARRQLPPAIQHSDRRAADCRFCAVRHRLGDRRLLSRPGACLADGRLLRVFCLCDRHARRHGVARPGVEQTGVTYSIVSAVGSGSLVGFMLGLLGGGGSILATPLLLYVVGVAEPHVAIGTGALAVSVNAFANFGIHAARRHVWWRCAIVFSALGMVGALAGSTLGKSMDGDRLMLLFGGVMVVIGALMLRPRKLNTETPRPVDARMCLMTAGVALVSGLASGFFGIGGGFLIVPGLMLATGMPMINAVGSSLLSVGAFGLATAINYAASGLVDWRLASEFVGGGIIGGVFGMLLSTRLSVYKSLLNRMFALLIFVVAGYVLYRSMPGLTSR
ncbi:sulfite exporter TauE/SafE family protein [Rhizobium sp. L51/94]|nr:sulfite exporter TauE/SafE family protein [Rhizobium sp. L51/94]